MKFQLTTILALALTSTAIANFVPVARSNNGIATRDMKNGQRRDEIPVEGEVAETDEAENSWDDEEFEGNAWDFETEGEEVARREDVGVPIEGAEAAEVTGGEGESATPEIEEEGNEDEGDEEEGNDEDEDEEEVEEEVEE